MTRVIYVFKELLRNLYRNPGTAAASILSLALLFLLFDLFWIGSNTSQKFYANLLSELRMYAYVDESVQEESIEFLSKSIDTISGIESVQYISRERARQELVNLVGTDLLVGYDEVNPLPRSYIISFSQDYLNSSAIEQIESSLKDLNEIGEISFSREWLEKAESTRKIILNVGAVLGALILITTVITCANNIRLMTRARAVGFWQMRLLGAGKIFVALPFLMEGFLIGGISALIGWGIILYGENDISFTQFELILPTIKEITLFCTAAGTLGVLSGYLGIRKLLK
jgi:cell division transport system permease protein